MYLVTKLDNVVRCLWRQCTGQRLGSSKKPEMQVEIKADGEVRMWKRFSRADCGASGSARYCDCSLLLYALYWMVFLFFFNINLVKPGLFVLYYMQWKLWLLIIILFLICFISYRCGIGRLSSCTILKFTKNKSLSRSWNLYFSGI